MGLKLGGSKGRRTLDKVEGFSTCIGVDSVFRGTLSGPGHCIVHGTVEGECHLAGSLVISDSGKWVGDITANTVLIAGTVEGDIYATDKMEIVSSAHIKGKIVCATLAIAEGAIHEGQLQMTSAKQKEEFVERRGPDYQQIVVDGGKSQGDADKNNEDAA